MLELDFIQIFGSYCLQICEILFVSGIIVVFGVFGVGKILFINVISGLI